MPGCRIPIDEAVNEYLCQIYVKSPPTRYRCPVIYRHGDLPQITGPRPHPPRILLDHILSEAHLGSYGAR